MAENYHGKVMSMDNRQAISEATIQFFNDNVFIGGGKSALDGTFSVSTPKRATKISVSYVGMETFVKNDSLGIPEDLGDICLNTFGISLGEVTVKGSLRRQSYDKDIYLITDSLRKGTSSSAQLLEKIPGVLRDWEMIICVSMDKRILSYWLIKWREIEIMPCALIPNVLSK